MDKYFPNILRNYISKQKQKSLFAFFNKKLSLKTNPATYFTSANFIGNGGGGGSLYNRFIPNFEINIKVKK